MRGRPLPVRPETVRRIFVAYDASLAPRYNRRLLTTFLRAAGSGCDVGQATFLSSAQEDFASGMTPPSATVSSAAMSRTVLPRDANRSSVIRLVMPDTEIAASGSLQSL
jgi:hypothetical protein